MISSYLDWWADAGLTDSVGDEPTDWLAAPARPVSDAPQPAAAIINDAGLAVSKPSQAAQRPAAAVSAPAGTAPLLQLPDDLAAFDAWLAGGSALPGRHWSATAVLPQGPVDAPLMLLADVPDPDDFAAGFLFAGAAGRLLDAMLAAIGMQRDQLRIASIAMTRPPAGRIEGPEAEHLLAMAHHHIAIARPRHVILLGQQSCSLLTGDVVPPDGQGQRQINRFGVNRAVTAIHHPRLLLKQPLLKRPTWTALKRLKELKLT